MKDSMFPQFPSHLLIRIFQACYEVSFLSLLLVHIQPWRNLCLTMRKHLKLWKLSLTQGPFSDISKMLADSRSFSCETTTWKPTTAAGFTGLRLAGCKL